ncbi:MAG: hypothetical protein R6U78_17390 [Bacteroidales bacterium]
MLYSNERFPEAMNDLPEDVRNKAIHITNSMIIDGDIRMHEDIIVAYAIHEAMLWNKKKKNVQAD